MKKRIISFVLVIVMAIGLMPTFTFAANTIDFAGGSGTQSDPYLIAAKAHLNNVRKYLGAHFKLMCDIDFNGLYWSPIGTEASAFTGTFDGNGFTIKNLNIYIYHYPGHH